MLYSPHGTRRYRQCEQMTLVLETPFDIAFCTFAPCGKTNTGFSSDHQKSMHSCRGSPRYSQKIFFSVIVDALYVFLNTFAQWKQTQWCHQKGFSPAHAKTFRIEDFKAQGKISEKKLIFRLNRLNFISIVKSIKEAIAIKQRKPSLNRDEGLDLPAIYSPLFGIYNSFSVTQPVTSQYWWSSINLDKILVFCLKFCS